MKAIKQVQFITSITCILFFCFAGCKKESVQILSSNQKAMQALVSDNSINNSVNVIGFSTIYIFRDEKTIFIGQANAQSSNVLISLIYLDVQKTITQTPDKKHLTVPFGDTKYTDLGWAYIISINPTTKKITLTPNDAMRNGIVAGSFEQRTAVFDQKSNSGSFATRFTALADNGNETEMDESFFKN